MKGLTYTEKKILAIAYHMSMKKSWLTMQDARRFYRTAHHVKEVVEFLHENGYLAMQDINQFISKLKQDIEKKI